MIQEYINSQIYGEIWKGIVIVDLTPNIASKFKMNKAHFLFK